MPTSTPKIFISTRSWNFKSLANELMIWGDIKGSKMARLKIISSCYTCFFMQIVTALRKRKIGLIPEWFDEVAKFGKFSSINDVLHELGYCSCTKRSVESYSPCCSFKCWNNSHAKPTVP